MKLIVFDYQYDQKINIDNLINMTYKDLLQIECYFVIKIDEKIFFEEPLFPILEFLYSYQIWNKNELKDFIYDTMECDDNPLIIFKKHINGWRIDSPWKQFNCDTVFEFKQLINSVDRLIYKINLAQ